LPQQAISHPYSIVQVAQIFVNEVVRLHGFPSSIVSNRDQLFLNHFWRQIFKHAGTKLNYSTTYHPQLDGQTKAVNCCLETYLRFMTDAHPKQWPSWLPWAEFWLNTNYSTSSN